MPRSTCLSWLSMLALSLGACTSDARPVGALELAEQALEQDPESKEQVLVVNERYRFELRRPGSEWLALDLTEQDHQIRGSLASAEEGALIVRVEARAGIATSDLSAIGSALYPEDARAEQLRFHGFDALRFHYVGDISGEPAHYVDTLFVRDGHLVKLSSGVFASRTPAAALELQDFFSPLPGSIELEPLAPPVLERAEAGWRIEAGVHESLESGWRYAPPADARVEVGEELRGSGSPALAVHTRTGVKMKLRVERVELPEAQARVEQWREHYAEKFGAPVERWRTVVAGRELELERHLHGGAVWDVAVEHEQGRVRRLLLRSGSATPEAERTELLGGFEAIPAEQLEQLRAPLLAAVRERRCPGYERSSYAGVYRDFAAGIEWRAPEGLWDLCLDDDSPDSGAATVLRARERERDIELNIELNPLEGELEQQLAARVGEREPLVGGALEQSGHRFEWRLLPREAGGLEYIALADHLSGARLSVVLSARHDTPELRAAMLAALTGLRIHEQLAPVELVEGRTLDHRLGLALRGPEGTTPKIEDDLLVWGDARGVKATLALLHLPFEGELSSEWVELLGLPKGEPSPLRVGPLRGVSVPSGKAFYDLIAVDEWSVMITSLEPARGQLHASFELL